MGLETKEKTIVGVAIINSIFSITTAIAWAKNPNLISYKRFESYSVMAAQFFAHIYVWLLLGIFLIERIFVKYVLKCKDQSIFYKNVKSNLLITYALLLYFSDKDTCRCIPDFFIYICHFTIYTTMASFKCVLDKYCKHVLESQISYDLIPEAQAKIKKIKVYYSTIKYLQILLLGTSFFLFSEVDVLRLYCLYTPGVKVLIDCFLSYENLYYKYKTTMSINERVITNTLNYCFALNTVSMLLQLGNYFLIFSKTGISITFSFIHMYYMMRNFKFFIVWIEDFRNFRVFHKYKRLIINKFPLKEIETGSEECPICLNGLIKARELACGHKFHLICLLQLIKNGDKKCPVCRVYFEENREQPQAPPAPPVAQPIGPFRNVPLRRNINQLYFYGLEDD